MGPDDDDGPRELEFFSMPAYDAWRSALREGDDIASWKIKYYKGLGTSTAAEARTYFSDLEKHVIPYSWTGDVDGERLDMAFRKSRAEDRKRWLGGTLAVGELVEASLPAGGGAKEPEGAAAETATATTAASKLRVSDFVDRELVLFSQADNLRSIPSAIDGLKPSQRKVLFACLKRKLDRPGAAEIKVAQLSGYISEHTAYHHGEQSLQSTIINMAQDFMGSNNLPLLYPSGQFGTRLQGGKDAASPRYIFTKLMPIVRKLFPQADDGLLEACEDDGMLVEPAFYVPVIPLVLVNGTEGIGTGWSTSVPLFNPLDLISWIEERLGGVAEPETTLLPWVRGFTGTLEPVSKKAPGHRFRSTGIARRVNSTTVEITELPVGRWTEDMKKILAVLAASNAIKGYREHHTEEKVNFVINMARNKLAAMERAPGGLEKAFKLEQSILTSNMHLFSAEGQIKKYDTAAQIVDDFYGVRLLYYEKRRLHQIAELEAKEERAENKARFLELVSDGTFELVGKSKADLEGEMVANAFTAESQLRRVERRRAVEQVEADEEEEDGPSKGSFDYLLRTPLSAFTTENVSAVIKEAGDLRDARVGLEQTTAEALWLEDLQSLRAEILRMKGATFQTKEMRKRKRKGGGGKK